MVTFVVERHKRKWQMRNDFNEDVKYRAIDLGEVMEYALDYCSWQNCDFRLDIDSEDVKNAAKLLGYPEAGEL